MPKRSVATLVPVLAVLGGLSCATVPAARVLTPGDRLADLPAKSPYLKAHAFDGRLWLFSRWSVDEASRTVGGKGRLLGPDRRELQQGELRVAASDVALFETNVPTRSATLAPLAVMTGVSVGMTSFCAANPKACFGSCPTFYLPDGDERVMMAEGFSDSIAPALEASDLDALFRARPRARRFVLEMTNEALETHVVRRVALLAARRPAGGRVLATAQGALLRSTQPVPPSACRSEQGDCRALLAHFDGQERFSRSDSLDLARREELDLEFETPPGDAHGLVIGARQTLLGTYLLYQTLGYMGSQASDWLARVERGDETVLRRAEKLRAVLGGIEVLTALPGGGWQRVAEIDEAGPLASDVKVVPLPAGAGPRTRVRLRLTRGHWRLDAVGLATLLGPAVASPLEPVEARGTTVASLAELRWPLTTLPGDRYAFTYELPDEPEALELFLDTRGYYLEWMRDEWVQEENAAKLSALLLDPAGAMRALAPEFHAREPELEQAFWRSRYVRNP